jgi:hypothetical protein
MASELEEVPQIVKRLSEEVKMTPIAWHVATNCITIVFAEGPKLSFSRDGDKPSSATPALRSAGGDRPGKEPKASYSSVKAHQTIPAKDANLVPEIPVFENSILPNADIPEFTGKGELKFPSRRGRPKK